MKYIIMFSAVIIGVLMGFFPRIDKPKPMVWKITAILILTLGIVLSIIPNIAGSFIDAARAAQMGLKDPVPVLFKYDPDKAQLNPETGKLELPAEIKSPQNRDLIVVFNSKELPANIRQDNETIINVKFDTETKKFEYVNTKSDLTFMNYPYLPLLLDRIRIMNFHVPMAWIAVIAYLVSMIYSIRYLSKRDMFDDIKASSANALGLLFTVLATVTGAVWAKFNWGMFWNWDPRQTSIFVLLLIYAAYFGLRSSIDKDELKARLSAVYSIIAFVTVPFLVFVIPRITQGLHPGSKGEGNAGPVLDPQGDMLSSNLLYSYGLALAGFTILFFWLMNLHIRYKKLKFSEYEF